MAIAKSASETSNPTRLVWAGFRGSALRRGGGVGSGNGFLSRFLVDPLAKTAAAENQHQPSAVLLVYLTLIGPNPIEKCSPRMLGGTFSTHPWMPLRAWACESTRAGERCLRGFIRAGDLNFWPDLGRLASGPGTVLWKSS